MIGLLGRFQLQGSFPQRIRPCTLQMLRREKSLALRLCPAELEITQVGEIMCGRAVGGILYLLLTFLQEPIRRQTHALESHGQAVCSHDPQLIILSSNPCLEFSPLTRDPPQVLVTIWESHQTLGSPNYRFPLLSQLLHICQWLCSVHSKARNRGDSFAHLPLPGHLLRRMVYFLPCHELVYICFLPDLIQNFSLSSYCHHPFQPALLLLLFFFLHA